MKQTARCAQVIAFAKQGLSIATIVNRTEFSVCQVKNCVSYWRRSLRAKNVELPPCVCGLPSNHMQRCVEKTRGPALPRSSPPDFARLAAQMSLHNLERHYRANSRSVHRWLAECGMTVTSRGFDRLRPPPIERIEQMASDGWSIRSIAVETKKSLRCIRQFVRRWRERLHADGVALPACRCGGPHDHSYYCFEKIRGEGIGRRARRQPPEDFEKVAPGLSVEALARHYRTGHLVVSRWLSDFPGLARLLATRRPKSLRPIYRARSGIDDTTYNLIERCVPTSYAPDVRADIISTIYLAVLDGSLPQERLLLDGRSVLYRVLKSHGVMYHRTVSIDEELNDEGARYIDLLADESSMDAFERIFEEE